MIEETLRQICEYIDDESAHYAMLLDGEWGSGKTWLIEHEVKKYLKEERGCDLYRISLYGVSSVQELNDRLRDSLLPDILSEGKGKIISQLGEGVLKSFTEKFGISLSVNSGDIVTLCLRNNSLLVFDDLERATKLDDKGILGAINNLVESRHLKVLLVANMSKTEEGNDSPKILPEDLEKIVWRKVHFAPTPKELVDSVLNGTNVAISFPNDFDFIELAEEKARVLGLSNARALIKSKRLLQEIANTCFITDNQIDLYIRKTVLKDVLYWTFRKAINDIPTEPYRPLSFDEMVEQSSTKVWGNEEVSLHYKALSFIETYFEDGFVPDDLSEQLYTFQKRFEHEGEIEHNAALSANACPYTDYEDDEAEKHALNLCKAFKSKSYASDKIPSFLLAYSWLRDWGFTQGGAWDEAVCSATEVALRDPSSTKIAIEENPAGWQVPGMVSEQQPRLDEIDVIRESVLKTHRQQSINNINACNADDYFEKTMEFLDAAMKPVFMPSSDSINIAIFDKDIFVRNVIKCSNKVLRNKVRAYFLQRKNLKIRTQDEADDLKCWLFDVIDALQKALDSHEVPSRMKVQQLQWMIENMRTIRDNIVPNTEVVGPVPPKERHLGRSTH